MPGKKERFCLRGRGREGRGDTRTRRFPSPVVKRTDRCRKEEKKKASRTLLSSTMPNPSLSDFPLWLSAQKKHSFGFICHGKLGRSRTEKKDEKLGFLTEKLAVVQTSENNKKWGL